MTRARRLPVAVGAVVALLVLALLSLGGGARSAGSAVTVPDRLAGYSYLTGDVSDAPPGRAVALYQHGFGVELLDLPQAVVLAADDDVYRRLDVAEDRAGPETQGDPAPMLLSPDGRSVALGDHDTSDPDLALVDLASGEVSSWPLPTATRSVRPVAWSVDGTRLAYLAGPRPTNPYRGGPLVGALHVLDLGSGDVEAVPAGTRATGAAFSPDGALLAVQKHAPRDTGVVVVDLATGGVRALPYVGDLAGADAWSPDGRLLAVEQPSGVVAVEVAGPYAPRAALVRVPGSEGGSVLGWAGDREVALLDPAPQRSRVLAVDLDEGTSRELTRVEGTDSYGVGRLQLATALTPDLVVREAGDADRGRLPLTSRVLAGLLVGLVAALVASRVTRRRSPRAGPA